MTNREKNHGLKPKGVLLLAFGGPDSLEAVGPFMANLMGRTTSPELVARATEKYKLVGGSSPLPGIARDLARALEAKLNEEGGPYRVYIGMRYWHPFITEALETMAADGVEEGLAISLSAHESRVTTGAYEIEVEKTLASMGQGLKITFAGNWHLHPGYIEALEEKLLAGLAPFPDKGAVPVIFTAHSLPLEHIRGGDPYAEQLQETVAALLERVEKITGPLSWQLAYQSKGAGRGEWLSPEIEEVLEKLAAEGHKQVLIDPVGFVADHMETLYDLDIALARYAQDLGLTMKRCSCLNLSPRFIEALSDMVKSHRWDND